jgi:hypothetical protein
MNLYHCLIELKADARALAFATVIEVWMNGLQEKGLIMNWRLMRRKLGLASGRHTDFLLEVELDSLSQLDHFFDTLSQQDAELARRYEQMHQMIAHADVGLYRPYPDPQQQERIALI